MKITGSTGNITEIVRVHKEAFPEFFLTMMDSPFLNLLYREFFNEQDGICLVAEENDRVLGFAAGTTNPNKFFRRLLIKKWPLFLAASIHGFAKHPLFVTRKCAGALFYRGENPSGFENAALLSSLAVSPEAAGRGLGRKLVEEFAETVKNTSNCQFLYLTTDTCDNDPVNQFYQKCGFTLHDTFCRPGKRKMNRWIKCLHETTV